MFDEAYPVRAFAATRELIQPTVNGAKQSDSAAGSATFHQIHSLVTHIRSLHQKKQQALLSLPSSQLQADSIPSDARRLKRRVGMNSKKKQLSPKDSYYPHLSPIPRTNDSRDAGISRRGFLGFAAASIVLAHTERQSKRSESRNGIPYRTLGRSGEQVSLVGLGGYHLGKQTDPQESIHIIRTGLDEGINFLDNCWDYNGGESEIRMGNALRDGYRQKAFLMSKIDGRTKVAATSQINESLRRLGTDRIDLLQFHEVIRDTDPDRIFAEAGGMEAVLEAQKAGKIRYIGFTGHKSPDIHLKMLTTASKHGFTFDAVQMPLNVMDAHFNSFENKVLPFLLKHDIGVLGMKPMGDHVILESKTATPVECLHYAMNLPTSVVITGCDSLPILQQALQAARSFQPLSASEVAALLTKTAKAAEAGQFELYKTSHQFDGTYANPQWLG
jgi:predicted aldo/keto reductase-like oxidoreductase